MKTTSITAIHYASDSTIPRIQLDPPPQRCFVVVYIVAEPLGGGIGYAVEEGCSLVNIAY
jgi:hypothetical protein